MSYCINTHLIIIIERFNDQSHQGKTDQSEPRPEAQIPSSDDDSSLDSEDDCRSGSRNITHQQQSFWRLTSPRRSRQTNNRSKCSTYFVFTLQFDAWIHEKLQIATDDSYRDPSNIQGKLQRHQAFEAEIASNKDGIDGINAVSCFPALCPPETFTSFFFGSLMTEFRWKRALEGIVYFMSL